MARTTPSFRSIASAGQGGSSGITPPMPTTFEANDILLLVCESSAEALTAPDGWTLLDQPYETTDVRLTVFWKRAVGGETSPTVPDPGDHVVGRIIAYQDCAAHGDFWNVVTGGVMSTAGTSVSITGVTTTLANCLILNIVASPFDTNISNQVDGWTNGNLTGLTERMDNFTTASNGGGIGMIEGLKATAGATGDTSVTLTNSATAAFMTIALQGNPDPEPATTVGAVSTGAPVASVGARPLEYFRII